MTRTRPSRSASVTDGPATARDNRLAADCNKSMCPESEETLFDLTVAPSGEGPPSVRKEAVLLTCRSFCGFGGGVLTIMASTTVDELETIE